MRTATGLALIATGAILAFAISAHLSFLNLQVTGWVLILTGVVGMVLPTRGYGWLQRKVVWRRQLPGGRVVDRVEESQGPSYLMLNSAASEWVSGSGDTASEPQEDESTTATSR